MRQFDFICGGAEPATLRPHATRIDMDVSGARRNVNLRISDINRAMVSQVPDLLIDLLEIAAYVYCGDQRANRGPDTLDGAGREWRRDLRFVIPVRHPEVWEQYALRKALQNTLGFLSDDEYVFEFRPATTPLPDRMQYFELTQGGMAAEEVVLFSGGIDSLAGALESIVENERKTVLVGHHSADKVFAVQKDLVEQLKRADHGANLFYVPVQVRNSMVDPTDTTQRSRSFLFASLAFVIAHMFGRNRITFYENGVVSLNLPIAKDVVGARATRTTHPKVVSGFEEIFSTLAHSPIEVRTPFLGLTKTQVVEKIVSRGFGQLLPRSVSCAHPREWTKEVRHCGKCSQCIDRRFAILAAGAEGFEPADGYKTDLLTGVRYEQHDLRMAVAYVKFCHDVRNSDRDRFATNYPDVYAAAAHVTGLTTQEAIDRFWDLHRRHAQAVLAVVEAGIREHAASLVSENLPHGALLSLCVGRTRLDPPPMADTTQQITDFMHRLQPQICDFAVDQTRKRILFKGGFFLDGADFRLFHALLDNHRTAKAAGREVPYFAPAALAEHLGISEETLRQRVSRLRATAIERLTVDQGLVFDADGFIENARIAGYRIDPQLREVSRADIEAADRMSQKIPSKVTEAGKQS